MSVMPPEITYGYVADRLVLAVGDGADGDRTPDARPAVGKVKFTPKTKVMPVSAPTPGRVLPQAIEASLDADGYLIDDQDAQGVWLVVGLYDVTYSFTSATVAGHEIEVTAAHTEAAPLYLTLAVPPGGPILTPSQYTELNNRLLVVEAGGGGGAGAVSSVNGQTGTVTLTAADVDALPDTYEPAWGDIPDKPATFAPAIGTTATTAMAGNTPIPATPGDIGAATAAQGTKADSAVQPADVTDVIREGDSRLTDARTPTSHTHTYADIADPPTIPGPQTLSLAGSNLTLSDGGGTVALPSGGGGGGGALQSTPGVGIYFMSPWVADTIDKPASVLDGYSFTPVPESVTIDSLSVHVHTAAASATGTIDVYEAGAGLTIGALISSHPGLDFATSGRKDVMVNITTDTGVWVRVTSSVTSVRLMAGWHLGPGAGIGNGSPSHTMPTIIGEYPTGYTTNNSPRARVWQPLVMAHRSA